MDQVISIIKQGVRQRILRGLSDVNLLFSSIDQEVSEETLSLIIAELDEHALTGTMQEMDELIDTLVSIGGESLKNAFLYRLEAVGQAIELIEYFIQRKNYTRDIAFRNVLDSMPGNLIGRQKRMLFDPSYKNLLIQYLDELRKNDIQRYVEIQGGMTSDMRQFFVKS